MGFGTAHALKILVQIVHTWISLDTPFVMYPCTQLYRYVIPTAEMTCKAVLSLRAFPNYCNCYIRDHNLLELINYHKILPSTHIISTATQLNTLLKKNKTFDLCIGEKKNRMGIYARPYKPGKEVKKTMILKEGEENRYVVPCCLLSLLMTTPHSHYFFFLLQE